MLYLNETNFGVIVGEFHSLALRGKKEDDE